MMARCYDDSKKDLLRIKISRYFIKIIKKFNSAEVKHENFPLGFPRYQNNSPKTFDRAMLCNKNFTRKFFFCSLQSNKKIESKIFSRNEMENRNQNENNEKRAE